MDGDSTLAAVAWRRFSSDAVEGVHLFEVVPGHNLGAITEALDQYPDHAVWTDFLASAAKDTFDYRRNYAYAAVPLMEGVVDRAGTWRNPREPFIHTESRYE